MPNYSQDEYCEQLVANNRISRSNGVSATVYFVGIKNSLVENILIAAWLANNLLDCASPRTLLCTPRVCHKGATTTLAYNKQFRIAASFSPSFEHSLCPNYTTGLLNTCTESNNLFALLHCSIARVLSPDLLCVANSLGPHTLLTAQFWPSRSCRERQCMQIVIGLCQLALRSSL